MTDIITQKISVEINQTAFNVDIASDKTVNIYNNTDAVWGDITGNLSDQDDLQTKLESIDSSITAAVALLNQAIAAKQDLLGFTAENTAKKGVANGYASLNSEGKVPQSQLDVATQILFYTFYTDLPETGEINKFYFVAFDSILYFWDGAYISISSSDYLLNFSSHINSQYLTLTF